MKLLDQLYQFVGQLLPQRLPPCRRRDNLPMRSSPRRAGNRTSADAQVARDLGEHVGENWYRVLGG